VRLGRLWGMSPPAVRDLDLVDLVAMGEALAEEVRR
jgi:hypothetical protein